MKQVTDNGPEAAMTARLLGVIAQRVQWTAFTLAALLLGTAVGVVAATGETPGPSARAAAIAGQSADNDDVRESPEAAKSAKPPKPTHAAKSAKPTRTAGAEGAQGVHGACVSAVARSDAVGGKNDNHGGAVSAAAKSCPKPSAAR